MFNIDKNEISVERYYDSKAARGRRRTLEAMTYQRLDRLDRHDIKKTKDRGPVLTRSVQTKIGG